MSFIKSEKISYTYPVYTNEGDKTVKADPALREVDLEVAPGSFICILGMNGSGKSTLARHLNALLLPDEGTLWIDGLDTKDSEKLWDIRSMVGMVFQNPDNQIISSVVDEDVAFGLENTAVPSEEIQERVPLALKSVGMEEFSKSSPERLSGGQKQRVAVAGILAMNPKCIVLDEATAMLDPEGREEVMDTVIRLNKERGITVIAITHYMDEALMADKIFVMGEGAVQLSGTPGEVFSQEEILEKWGLKLPEICSLAARLRKKLPEMPGEIIFEDELRNWIIKRSKNEN